jgi:hypothetical protein
MLVRKLSLEEHFRGPGPKRILTLDGGGVRGVLTLGVLEAIERRLRTRYGDETLVLADYFDLVAGTSTGAIIAAALASGMSVGQIQQLYTDLAQRIFRRTIFRDGFLRAKYDAAGLTSILQEVFKDATLGSKDLRTGLLVVMKRADTGSPWPVSNNPAGKYYAPERSSTIPNKDYPLWAVVRASTAAPSFFDPEFIQIATGRDGTAISGTFVDGGVSTANNPALLAFRFATLKGYRVSWQVGQEQLLLVSVGTGSPNPDVVPSTIAAKAALEALLALMDDCNSEIETMLQWLGKTDTGRKIDSEVGALADDQLGPQKLLTYQRYNVELSPSGLNEGLAVGLSASEIQSVQEMDAPENVPILQKIGQKLGERVLDHHLPSAFDLVYAAG